jgi:hypothetical protein
VSVINIKDPFSLTPENVNGTAKYTNHAKTERVAAEGGNTKRVKPLIS